MEGFKRKTWIKAIKNNDLDELKGIVQQHPKFETATASGAIRAAIDQNREECLAILINHVNERQTKTAWNLALGYSAAVGNHDTLALSLQNGAAVDSLEHFGCPPVQHAAAPGHLECLKTLIQHNAPVDQTEQTFCGPHNTALHKAAANGHTNCTTVLLRQGADANSRDRSKNTPIHYAVGNNHIECVNVLVEHGATVNSENIKHITPLHCATLKGHLTCVTALLRERADVNSQNHWGNTSLHHAAEQGHVDCFEKLLQCGADVNIKNIYSQTPLDVVAESTRDAIKQIVHDYGCQQESKIMNSTTNSQPRREQPAITVETAKAKPKLQASNRRHQRLFATKA